MKKTIGWLLLLASIAAQAQTKDLQILDEVVAVVGENVILKSELETEYAQAKKQMNFYEGDLKCEILNQLVIQKLYLHKGEVDSTYAEAARVDEEVNRRIQYYASQIGGEARLEQYLGKSVDEYKAQMRPKIEEQIITQKVQQGLVADVKASPTDVRLFFADIPMDSLPNFGKEVEFALVSMKPKPSEFAKQYAYETLEKLREDIISGRYSFDFAAKSNSDDKGTSVNGGELGYFARGQMVSAFERTAFKLKKDSISEIIETEFGYHIIQVIDRKGEKVNARHILIKPLIVPSDLVALKEQMTTLISAVQNDSLTLCQVARKYSSDAQTKDNCGFYADPSTGSQQVPVAALPPLIAAKAESMQPGDFSQPAKFSDVDGSEGYRFFYLRKVVPAHKANLKDDYQKIQTLATEKKQETVINDWVEGFKGEVYVWIDEKYVNCSELEGWKGLSNN
ncbi:peptidylprolyl isomerase [Bacteroidia bacterium]|nr:hypothetical protein [Bacteroidota bacterium]MDA8930398.1 peptidylprolyl isomerase [Bacteroidia bacterium]MDA9111063.1 peptidylprolyl isomerase [Bacteroidia bacterium]MDB4173465.1 peptidylprolyl isomerase [Bacteroidia bacterium]